MTHTLNEEYLHLFCVQPPANRHTLLMPHRAKISSLTAVTCCRLELQPVVTKIPKCEKRRT